MNDLSEKQPSRLRNLWAAVHHFFASPLHGLLALLAIVVMLGISFIAAEELNIRANSTEFCVSCHSMEAYVYQEFKESKHYNNVSGVRPECGSCHVSDRFWPAVWDHMLGTHDLIAEFSHDWTDPAVFEARRDAMAEKVRLAMIGNNSKNCKTCHVMEAITPSRKRGERAHNSAMEKGDSNCIACHYNLVHKAVELTPRFKAAVDGRTQK